MTKTNRSVCMKNYYGKVINSSICFTKYRNNWYCRSFIYITDKACEISPTCKFCSEEQLNQIGNHNLPQSHSREFTSLSDPGLADLIWFDFFFLTKDEARDTGGVYYCCIVTLLPVHNQR